MGNLNFENITVKFFTESISSEELDSLILGLENDENISLFQSYLKIDYTTRYNMSQYNSEKLKDLLSKKIRAEKRSHSKLRVKGLLKYAAVGLFFVLIGFLYEQMTEVDESVHKSIIDTNAITLTLSDGSVKEIAEEESISIIDYKGSRIGLQKGNQLIYHKAALADKIAYNTLYVPYGKQFTVILSDGTKAYLNSGTSLKYPIEFNKREQRQVFLKGEGFFKVSKDTERPFVVNTNELNVQVLGTEFNLSAYAEDENIETVLVEGSVGFFERDSKFNEKNQKLEPGHMARWQKQKGKISFKETNVNLYTGWMDGKIIFNDIPFRDIVKKLERNFNVSITNTYEELENKRFTATFDTETIMQILTVFNTYHPIHYSIEGDQIKIEKP